VFDDLCQALEIKTRAEVFCLPLQEINAFAVVDVREAGTYSFIGVTAAALERLDDAELRSILGHELGHILFGNNRLDALISTDKNNPAITVLPALGESLFLRWRKKAEISADRVSLLASRDLRSTATSLLKATFGLSEKNLNLDIEALLTRWTRSGPPELRPRPAAHPAAHPPQGARAVLTVGEGERSGFLPGTPAQRRGLENAVDELVGLTRRYPLPLHQAMMRVVRSAARCCSPPTGT
jgi:Zn-dependent protease with chaperone function